MTTHSSMLAWEIPWTEEPGGLQSVGSWSWTRLSTHALHMLFNLISQKPRELQRPLE